MKKRYQLIRVAWLYLVLGTSLALAQPPFHPDRVYPIPDNLGEVNESGVNLFTGDLNLEFTLAAISGRDLSYELSAFYNSYSASSFLKDDVVDNTLGGKGWKLMDYPKVVQAGSDYYFLDGQAAYPLAHSGSNQYMAGKGYYLWQFEHVGNDWEITTESGTSYHLTNRSEEMGWNFWHLGQIVETGWGDHLDFTYTDGRLDRIINSLGDELVLRYGNDGHLEEVEIYHDQTVEGREALMEERVVLTYNDRGITTIENSHRMTHGVFSEAKAPLQFHYNAENLLHEVISPSGAVQRYTYYTGDNHPEVVGKVIRFSVDNGYETIIDDGGQSLPIADEDASYAAIWYVLTNAGKGDYDFYSHFNQVRVYPGGFREESNYVNTDANLQNPFGHQVYYFFNGATATDLVSLPEAYASASIPVTDDAFLGMVYKTAEYSDQSVVENDDHQISVNHQVYALKNYTVGDATVFFSQLQRSVSSMDGVDAVTTWYEYYEASDYLLPKATAYSRLNPKEDDPDHREFEKSSIRYAFQDYAALRNYRMLNTSSRTWATVARHSGEADPFAGGLDWKVTDAQLTAWQAWPDSEGHGWAPKAGFVLKTEATEEEVSNTDIASISKGQWLKTGETLERNADGFPVTQRDVDNLESSTIYDSHYGFYPIAGFSHANVAIFEANYLGFETYEKDDAWDLSGGSRQIGHSLSRGYVYGGSGAVNVTAAKYNPRDGVSYVFSAFVRLKGATAGTIGFSTGTSWTASQSIPLNDHQWQYVSVIIEEPSTGSLPTIQCNDCLVDDVRYHPVDAPFSATVYKDEKVVMDEMEVNAPGHFSANDVATLADGFTLSAGSNLTVRAGALIQFETGTTVSIAKGATASFELGDFAVDMNQPVATLGVNGEVYRQVYDGMDRPLANVGPNGQLRSLNISYNSREGIAMFGDSHVDDPHFDEAYPNMALQLTARDRGLWEGFEDSDNLALESLHQLTADGGQLITLGSAGTGVVAPVTAPDYAVHVEVLPNQLSAGQEMGLEVFYGLEFVRFGIKNNEVRLHDSGGGDLATKSLHYLPEHVQLTLVVMEGTHLFAYLNGRFLFEHTFTSRLDGDIRMVSSNVGGRFDNFMVLEDPIIGKQTYDALGQPKQTLLKHEPDELYVTETLYGDYQNLPMASTRGTHVSTGNTESGLAYRPGFATLDLNGQSSPSVSGEVSAAHGYNTPFTASVNYEDDPSLRADRSGGGGAFTAGAGKSTNHEYGANEDGAFGFEEESLSHETDHTLYTEGQTITEDTYSGQATGAIFASKTTDVETGQVQQEQAVYDEQLRLKKHLQPNAFEGNADYYSEIGYDFLGNVTYERDPDQGAIQHAYGPTYRHRLSLDAEGATADPPYYHYWKYDALGRVVEEGLYEGSVPGSAEADHHFDPTKDGSVITPGTLTVGAGTVPERHVELKAGFLITFEQGFSIEASSSTSLKAEIAEDALQQQLAGTLADPDWPPASDAARKLKKAYTYDYQPATPESHGLGRLVAALTYHEPGDPSQGSNTERYTYDLLGRTTSHTLSVTDAGTTEEKATTFQYVYDLYGQLQMVTKEVNSFPEEVTHQVHYGYDRLGRVVSVGTEAEPEAYAAYAYDNDGFTETLGGTVTNRYQSNEEVLLESITSTVGGNQLFSETLFYTNRYNDTEDGSGYYNGNIASIQYASGERNNSHNYYYDGFGRLNSRDQEAASTYAYDPNGNFTSKGGVAYSYESGTNRLDQAGSATFTYDAVGRIRSDGRLQFVYDAYTSLTTRIQETNGYTLSFRYNADNQRISKQVEHAEPDQNKTIRYFHGLNDYPMLEAIEGTEGNSVIHYVYGPTGLIAMKQEGWEAASVRYVATMETAVSAAESTTFQNLGTTRRTFQVASHSPNEVAMVGGTVAPPVGPAIQLQVQSGDVLDLRTWAYYEGTEKQSVVGAEAMVAAIASSFGGVSGAAGEAGKVAEGIAEGTAALGLAGGEDEEAPKAYLNYLLFDEDLNYVSGGFQPVTSSAFMQQESLELAQVRVSEPGYLYAYVSNESGTAVYFDDLAVTVTPASGWHYVVKDHLGSTRVVTDGAGAVVARFNYDDFGNGLEDNTVAPDHLPMAYRYTGQEYDLEVDLYNYRARMYSTVTGRFYAPDLMGQQNSAYAYVGNNPISFTDPTGMWSWKSLGMTLIGVTEGIAGVGLNMVAGGLDATGIGAIAGIGLHTAGAALMGAGFNAVTSGASAMWSDQDISWSEFGIGQATGAVEGVVGMATGGAAEAAIEAGSIGGAVVYGSASGAASSLASKLTDNALHGNELTDGLVSATLSGAASGAALSGIRAGYQKWKLPSCGCFTKGTLVKTAEGDKPIQTIQAGDEVWAYNEVTAQTELRTVVRSFTLAREATYTLHIGDQAIETTSDHPFYNGTEWVTAGKLQAGDSVQLLVGSFSDIQSIAFKAGYTQVYNFEVGGLHNYYVGEDGVLVHNARSCLRSKKRYKVDSKKGQRYRAGNGTSQQHVLDRHANNTIHKNVSKFSKDFTDKTLKNSKEFEDFVVKAATMGMNAKPNSFIYNTGKAVGRSRNGNVTNSVMIIFDKNGVFRTMYPN